MQEYHAGEHRDQASVIPEPLTSGWLADIAARAVWNPANVSATEVQIMAASLAALIRRGDGWAIKTGAAAAADAGATGGRARSDSQ